MDRMSPHRSVWSYRALYGIDTMSLAIQVLLELSMLEH